MHWALIMTITACGPVAALAMNVRTSRTPIAKSADGVTLFEVREDGPEGGGALTYRVQGKAPGDIVDLVVSANFSPGNGTRPQTVSPETCRQRLAALGAELAKHKILGVTVHPDACVPGSRSGLVSSEPETNDRNSGTFGPNWRVGMPADVVDFVERYGACNHWQSEPGYGKERRKEIESAVRKLRCLRLEADGQKLLKKYAGKFKILRAIDDAENYEL